MFIGRGLNRKSLMMGFKTCVWQPLPDGWREAFDPVTNQPYYYNPSTHEKTWARPQVGGRAPGDGDAVTVTPVVPIQQPRNLQPGRRRNGAAPGGGGGGAGGGGAGGGGGGRGGGGGGEGGKDAAASCASALPTGGGGGGAGGNGGAAAAPRSAAAGADGAPGGPPAATNGGAALSDTL